jgi:malate dehydrogenase (oxaloacetate-decarboxylating)
VTTDIKIVVAEALAGLVDEPVAERIVPSVFDERIVPGIADAIGACQGQRC